MVALFALITCSASAQSWYTVDDFQYTPGSNTLCIGLAKDPTGTIIYSAGYGRDVAGVLHALAFQSSDGGTNWALLDDYFDPTVGADHGTTYAGIEADPSSGKLYVSGHKTQTVSSGVAPTTWFTRCSWDSGQHWSDVDSFTVLGGASPGPIAADAAGNVYVAGQLSSPGTYWTVRKGTGGTSWATVDQFAGDVADIFCHPTAGVFAVGDRTIIYRNHNCSVWTVRRSQDGGATWSTVDTFQFSAGCGSMAWGGGFDAAGNIYVVGSARQIVKKGNTGLDTWVVRKSADRGASWQTVDSSLTSSSSLGVGAHAFAADAKGNLFVAGNMNGQWAVRESEGGTGPWQTVDTFLFSSGKASLPRAILGDSLGNIFVAGQASSPTGLHWIVRKY